MNLFGSRALSMGGAQVALVNDATAAYWNPAAFGNQANFSTTDTAFGFAAMDNLTQYVTSLDQYYQLRDELSEKYPDFEDYFANNSEEAHRYVDDIVASLNAFNEPGVGVVWNLHSGVATRVGPAVFSWLYENRLEVGPWVDTHLSRLIPSEYLQSPDNVIALYTEGLLTEEELRLLWPGYDPDNPDRGAFAGDEPDNAIGLEDNQSLITFSGLVLNNIALSYGYSFELGRDEYIAVGASLKYIHGERNGDSVSILNDIDLGDFDPSILDVGGNLILNNIFTLESLATGSGFSIDIGVQGKLGEHFRYGLLARNIIPTEISWNDPRFTPTPINPELRLGAAYEPFEGLNLAMDLDILAVEYLSYVYNPLTGVEEDSIPYTERNIALGAEWNIEGIFDLRAGVSTNYNALFEETSPGTFILSAGVGFNIGEILHMDLAVMSNLVTPRDSDASLGGSFSLGFAM
jgi:hypothetical protein